MTRSEVSKLVELLLLQCLGTGTDLRSISGPFVCSDGLFPVAGADTGEDAGTAAGTAGRVGGDGVAAAATCGDTLGGAMWFCDVRAGCRLKSL